MSFLRALRSQLPVAGSLLLLNFAVLAAHIFSQERLVSVDGMYHLRMARLYAERGLFTDFPWMQFAFTQDYWVDHHLLYHLLLIPLSSLQMVPAQQWAGALFGALALTACSLYLLRHRVPRVWLFAPLLLLSSDMFLFRMMMARSMSLALVLIIVLAHALEHRKRLVMLLASFLFIWSYHAALVALPMALGYTLLLRYRERRWDYAPLVFTGAGLLFGLTLNPFFPQTFTFLFFHTLPLSSLASGGGAEVPANFSPWVGEWRPMHLSAWLLTAGPALVAAVAVPLACWRGRARWSAGILLLGLLALAGLCASLFSARALEYAVPLAFITAARVLAVSPPEWPLRARRAVYGAALALLLGLGVLYHLDLRDDFTVDPRPVAGAARWLEQNTKPGSVVFHADYTMWSYLFMHNVHNNYIVGLSPLWMYNWDPQRYLIYRATARAQGTDPVATIRDYFRSEFAVLVPWDRNLLKAMDASPRARRVYGDQHTVVFRLR